MLAEQHWLVRSDQAHAVRTTAHCIEPTHHILEHSRRHSQLYLGTTELRGCAVRDGSQGCGSCRWRRSRLGAAAARRQQRQQQRRSACKKQNLQICIGCSSSTTRNFQLASHLDIDLESVPTPPPTILTQWCQPHCVFARTAYHHGRGKNFLQHKSLSFLSARTCSFYGSLHDAMRG